MTALAFALLLAPQDAIKWAESPEKAFVAAARGKKLVLLYFTKEKSGWCEKMDKDSLGAKAVIERVAKDFVALRVDIVKDEAYSNKWDLEGVPTCIVADETGDFVSHIIGFRTPEDTGAWLDLVVGGVKKIREAKAKLKVKEDQEALHRTVGETHYELGNNRKAIDALTRAADLARTREEQDKTFLGETLVLLSDALRTANRIEPLPAIGRELEALDPDGKLGFRDNALYLLALVEHFHGQQHSKPERSKKALELLKEAESKYPDSDKGDEILLWLAVLYHDLEKDRQSAATILEKLTKRHPDSDLVPYAEQTLKILKEALEKEKAARAAADFSNPRAAVATFLKACNAEDADLLSRCFSKECEKEFASLRDKTASVKEIRELKEFFEGASILEVKEEGTSARVRVKLEWRGRGEETLHLTKEADRWLIFGF
jgi:uncharacterized protein YyaL (SSP411 family)